VSPNTVLDAHLPKSATDAEPIPKISDAVQRNFILRRTGHGNPRTLTQPMRMPPGESRHLISGCFPSGAFSARMKEHGFGGPNHIHQAGLAALGLSNFVGGDELL